MSDYIKLKDQDFSFLGRSSKLKGEFQLVGPTRISSTIEGVLRMSNKAHLTLEIDGRLKGEIQCHDIEVYGEILGDINSTGRVTFHSSSRFQGRISSKELVIRPGADLNMDGHTVET